MKLVEVRLGISTFVKKGFSFVILHASTNFLEEIDRFYNWVIRVVNNFVPSFRNIPGRLSIPEALVPSKSFQYFEYSL